jgi:chorismate--pyruvate lyase
LPAGRGLGERASVRGQSLRLAKWHGKAAAVGADGVMRDWLATPGSLTARLVAHSDAFRVQRLHQKTMPCSLDEAAPIGLARRERVREREVLLCCDGVPVVLGHTVVPLSATARDWPLFSALGERSLGSTLFYDPKVRRGPLAFARLRPGHPLLAQVRRALGFDLDGNNFYARRCVYRRHQGLLMVTEVFLPAVMNLTATATIAK